MKDITYCNDSLCIKKTCSRHPINLIGDFQYVSRSDFKECKYRDHGLLNLISKGKEKQEN